MIPVLTVPTEFERLIISSGVYTVNEPDGFTEWVVRRMKKDGFAGLGGCTDGNEVCSGGINPGGCGRFRPGKSSGMFLLVLLQNFKISSEDFDIQANVTSIRETVRRKVPSKRTT